MIYMLRGLYEILCSIPGNWWFDAQTPLDLEPVPATVTETAEEATEEVEYVEIDDGTPLPPPTSEGKSLCVSCGDPNFSLDSEVCVACRSIGGYSKRGTPNPEV